MKRLHEKYNLTPFVAGFFPCMDEHGADHIAAILKATFQFSDDGRLTGVPRETALPVFLRDAFHGDPGRSSVRYPSDIVPRKRGTDVILNGHAYGRGKDRVEAGFRIGSLVKEIHVFGPRRWERGLTSPGVSKAAPFERMPLKYENAYGGSFEDDRKVRHEDGRNPVGSGFMLSMVDGWPASSLEYPKDPLRAIGDRPAPAAFGAIPAGWMPRARFAGTFDDAWMRTRRPLFPADFDERFFNVVPEDQVLDPKLRGGEMLTLRNVHPRRAEMTVAIPRLEFTATFRVKERTETVPMVADTLLVEPDENRFSIGFRASHAIGNDLHYLKSVHFETTEGSSKTG